METSSFRDCVQVILEHLQMWPVATSYVDDVVRLNEACADWHRVRAPLQGFPKFLIPDPVRPALVSGNLDDADAAGFLGNAAAHDFIKFVDRETNRRCTLLMFQICIWVQLAQRELRHQVNTTGGTA